MKDNPQIRDAAAIVFLTLAFMCFFIFLITSIFGPNSDDFEKRCKNHMGVMQINLEPFRPNSWMVVCHDGVVRSV